MTDKRIDGHKTARIVYRLVSRTSLRSDVACLATPVRTASVMAGLRDVACACSALVSEAEGKRVDVSGPIESRSPSTVAAIAAAVAIAVSGCANTGSAPTDAATVTVEYGTVVGVETVSLDEPAVEGAVIGGILGAVLGGAQGRLIRTAGFAMAGSYAQAALDERMATQFTVRLNDGDEVVITTELQTIYENDCVAVERGDYANIRRVSTYYCEQASLAVDQRHQQMADQCDAAKGALLSAGSDDAIEDALVQSRVLCED